jgi:hypothetical protein
MKDGQKDFPAVVEKIIPYGRHGPYAVARSGELGCVTFALDKKVWKRKECPQPGTYVMLSEIRKKCAGWRAESVRYISPYDEQQQATSNKQRRNRQ